MIDMEREVAEERAAQGLPPRVRDPLILRRVAALVHAPTYPSTSSAAAVDAGHPEPRNDGAPGAALSVPGTSSELGVARDAAYLTTATA